MPETRGLRVKRERCGATGMAGNETENHGVGGSIPSLGTNEISLNLNKSRGLRGVLQRECNMDATRLYVGGLCGARLEGARWGGSTGAGDCDISKPVASTWLILFLGRDPCDGLRAAGRDAAASWPKCGIWGCRVLHPLKGNRGGLAQELVDLTRRFLIVSAVRPTTSTARKACMSGRFAILSWAPDMRTTRATKRARNERRISRPQCPDVGRSTTGRVIGSACSTVEFACATGRCE